MPYHHHPRKPHTPGEGAYYTPPLCLGVGEASPLLRMQTASSLYPQPYLNYKDIHDCMFYNKSRPTKQKFTVPTNLPLSKVSVVLSSHKPMTVLARKTWVESEQFGLDVRLCVVHFSGSVSQTTRR